MGLFDFLFGGSKKGNPADSVPQTDAEKWSVAVYALWSEFSKGSYKYFGGFEKNSSNSGLARRVLDRDWLVTDKASALDTINYLLKDSADKDTSAFDYGCAANMAARCYLCDLLTREEMMAEEAKVAELIRAHYNSWDEFVQNYIEQADKGMNGGSSDHREELRQIYARLRALPDSPYSIDWNTAF